MNGSNLISTIFAVPVVAWLHKTLPLTTRPQQQCMMTSPADRQTENKKKNIVILVKVILYSEEWVFYNPPPPPPHPHFSDHLYWRLQIVNAYKRNPNVGDFLVRDKIN